MTNQSTALPPGHYNTLGKPVWRMIEMAKIMDLLEELEVLEALRVKTEDVYINNILFIA